MNLVRYNPRYGLSKRTRRSDRFFDEVFDDFFTPFFLAGNSALASQSHGLKVDIYQKDDAVIIDAELPGVEKDNIVIDVKDRVLTLKGERSSDSNVEEENYFRRERTFGSFERRFNLPDNVEPEKITADYKDGVLKVGIPKPEAAKAKKITVH